jgi:predicted peptidase
MLVLAPTEFGSNPGYGFTARERAAHLAALRWARRTFNVDENAIFVGGWSRGGQGGMYRDAVTAAIRAPRFTTSS